jgi:nuclear pore complex protein Nup133
MASTSDEVLIARLRSTAFYQTLQRASQNKATSDVILNPSECLLPTSLQSIEARFKSEPLDFIQAVEGDYTSELERAREVIEMGTMRGWFDDVMRLIAQAKEEAEQSQSVMEEEDSQFMAVY